MLFAHDVIAVARNAAGGFAHYAAKHLCHHSVILQHLEEIWKREKTDSVGNKRTISNGNLGDKLQWKCKLSFKGCWTMNILTILTLKCGERVRDYKCKKKNYG